MNTEKMVRVASIGYISFSALSLLSVSVMAFANPQDVMDLVGVKLPNTDAYSSIRGVYGGVGLTIVISLLYLMRSNTRQALGFLAALWGCYALSRGITIAVEGPLGAFGTQWIITEAVLCAIALVLLRFTRRHGKGTPERLAEIKGAPGMPARAYAQKSSMTLFLAPVPPPAALVLA